MISTFCFLSRPGIMITILCLLLSRSDSVSASETNEEPVAEEETADKGEKFDMDVSESQVGVPETSDSPLPPARTGSNNTDNNNNGTIEEEEDERRAADRDVDAGDEDAVADDEEQLVEANWDMGEVIRDVGYFLRAHKFQDYDRRYFKSVDDVPRRLYEEFPRPALRSLHWEVRQHCDVGFAECLKYLERIIKLAALRREDDTVSVMKEQKWNLTNNTQQILTAQRDCHEAQRRDDPTMPPFQGPIERFQWRTTASYYMCWYTMSGIRELALFGESCDNHANCLDVYAGHNGDPRADDGKPYACALYSFCPDHCCPMKHIWHMKDCFQSPRNPCYAPNPPGHRTCRLQREENRDFASLITNQINITCECAEPGYKWSSRFGLCVDVNECSTGDHNCSPEDGQMCMNLPGSYDCVCVLGSVYDPSKEACVESKAIGKALGAATSERNTTEVKSLLGLILRAINGAGDETGAISRFVVLVVLLLQLIIN